MATGTLSEVLSTDSQLRANDNFSFTQIKDVMAKSNHQLISGGISRISECERRWLSRQDAKFDGKLFFEDSERRPSEKTGSRELWGIFNKDGLKRVKQTTGESPMNPMGQ